jgi:hypothetical protein
MMLYRFVPPGREDFLFRERLLSFSPPKYLNDPFDFRPRIKPIRDARLLGEIMKPGTRWWQGLRAQAPWHLEPGQREAWVEREMKQFAAFLANPQCSTLLSAWIHEMAPEWMSDTIGVLCFAKTRDNLLLWSHYTSAHQGYALEFDSSQPGFRSLGDLMEVTYSKERPEYDLHNWTDVRPMMTKSVDWEYEQECRVVRLLSKCSPRPVSGRTHYVVPLPVDSLKSVYFGVRCAAEIQKTVQSLLKGTGVRFLRGTVHPHLSRILWIKPGKRKFPWDAPPSG